MVTDRRKELHSKGWAVNERGSGSVLGLLVMLVSVAALAVLAPAFEPIYLGAKAQSIADLAAVAAEDSLRGLTTGIPCEVAVVVVAANGAQLTRCRIVENSVYVRLRLVANQTSIVAEAAASE